MSAQGFKVLAELAQLGARATSPAQLATQVLTTALSAVGADGGDLCVLSGYARYPLHSHWPGLPLETERTPAPLADPSVQKLVHDAVAVAWPASQAPGSLGLLARRLGYASCASAPILAGGRPVGTLDCAARREAAFDAEALALLTAMGALLGPILDLALGVSSTPGPQLEQSLLELQALQRVAEAVSRSLDLDEVLSRCLDVAAHVAHATAAAIYLREEKRGVYRLRASRGMPHVALLDTIPGDLIDERFADSPPELMTVSDSPEDPVASEARRLGFERVIAVPLRVEKRLVGLLGLNFQAPMTFIPSTVLTLEAIAAQEAVAIETARAHHALEVRARVALKLREFGERALATVDDNEIYRLIMETAVQITRGDRALIARAGPKAFIIVAGLGKDERLVGMESEGQDPYLESVIKGGKNLVVEDTSVLDPATQFGRVARENQTASLLLHVIRYSNRPIGILFCASGTPVRYENEEVEAMGLLASMAGEALERARVQAEVELERRRLDATIEHLPIVVAVLNAKGDVTSLNAAGRRFAEEFGAPPGSWSDSFKSVRSFLPDGSPIPPDDYQFVRAFRGEHPGAREIQIVSTANGKRKIVMGVAAPIQYDEAGRVTHVVTGFQDVSALRELADAKDRFLRIASHELRSPITSLRATTSLLEMDPTAVSDPERRAVMLQRIKRQVDRLIRLVEQLLDSARMNATEVPFQRVPCDLIELAREATALAAVSVGARAERVRIEAPGSLEGEFDAGRLEQVLSNLLGNALRYSPDEAEVSLTLAALGERIRIEVRDRGIGIPEDQLEHIFSPFFRASNAAQQHKGGLGLGLYIANEIVKRHGGNMRVASKVGEGTTFTVELPR